MSKDKRPTDSTPAQYIILDEATKDQFDELHDDEKARQARKNNARIMKCSDFEEIPFTTTSNPGKMRKGFNMKLLAVGGLLFLGAAAVGAYCYLTGTTNAQVQTTIERPVAPGTRARD